jgi:N utilization substance protein B
VRVVVDEYVSIAHAFFSGVEAGFANAMLDALARRIRPGAFETGHDGQSG